MESLYTEEADEEQFIKRRSLCEYRLKWDISFLCRQLRVSLDLTFTAWCEDSSLKKCSLSTKEASGHAVHGADAAVTMSLFSWLCTNNWLGPLCLCVNCKFNSWWDYTTFAYFAILIIGCTISSRLIQLNWTLSVIIKIYSKKSFYFSFFTYKPT